MPRAAHLLHWVALGSVWHRALRLRHASQGRERTFPDAVVTRDRGFVDDDTMLGGVPDMVCVCGCVCDMAGVVPDIACVVCDMSCVVPDMACVVCDMAGVVPDMAWVVPVMACVAPGMVCVAPGIGCVAPDMGCVDPMLDMPGVTA